MKTESDAANTANPPSTIGASTIQNVNVHIPAHISGPELPEKSHLSHFNDVNFSVARPDDKLANLTPEQTAILNRWLFHDEKKYEEVRRLIAQPAPVGFGLDTSVPAIGRYYRKNHLIVELAENDELAQLVADRNLDLPELLRRFASHALFNRKFDPRAFNTLIRLHRTQLLAQRDSDQKTHRERHLHLLANRLQLETLKVQINVARKALEHAARLQAILANNQTDDEDKIHEARGLIFDADYIPTPEK